MITSCYNYQLLWLPAVMITSCYEYQLLWLPAVVITSCYDYQLLWSPAVMITSCYDHQFLWDIQRIMHQSMRIPSRRPCSPCQLLWDSLTLMHHANPQEKARLSLSAFMSFINTNAPVNANPKEKARLSLSAFMSFINTNAPVNANPQEEDRLSHCILTWPTFGLSKIITILTFNCLNVLPFYKKEMSENIPTKTTVGEQPVSIYWITQHLAQNVWIPFRALKQVISMDPFRDPNQSGSLSGPLSR